MNNNKKLKMKEVGNEYMEQYNDLLRYVFQVTDQELDSIDWEEKEIIRNSNIYQWYKDNLHRFKNVRIIKNRVEKAINDMLKRHPHVKSYRYGMFGEGETGVTIVELK